MGEWKSSGSSYVIMIELRELLLNIINMTLDNTDMNKHIHCLFFLQIIASAYKWANPELGINIVISFLAKLIKQARFIEGLSKLFISGHI